jgi:hypothetical protein
MFSVDYENALAHFQANLGVALGDLETMLAGLWYRLQHEGAQLNPRAIPPGYRSPALRVFLREVCGANKTTKWGPTALRGGDLKASKQHIIAFFELVNQLDASELQSLLKACGLAYAQHVNTYSRQIPCLLRHIYKVLSLPSSTRAEAMARFSKDLCMPLWSWSGNYCKNHIR